MSILIRIDYRGWRAWINHLSDCNYNSHTSQVELEFGCWMERAFEWNCFLKSFRLKLSASFVTFWLRSLVKDIGKSTLQISKIKELKMLWVNFDHTRSSISFKYTENYFTSSQVEMHNDWVINLIKSSQETNDWMCKLTMSQEFLKRFSAEESSELTRQTQTSREQS